MQTAVVLAEMSNTFKALQAGLTVEGITMYLFWLGIVGMGAGAAYLFMMQGSLTKTYKKVAIVAGIICGVACFHYYRMAGIYVESLAMAISTDADGNIVIGELAAFPTAYRYIDWLITVPLMVLEFPLLLNLGKKGKPLFWGLGGVSLAMLGAALFGVVFLTVTAARGVLCGADKPRFGSRPGRSGQLSPSDLLGVRPRGWLCGGRGDMSPPRWILALVH